VIGSEDDLAVTFHPGRAPVCLLPQRTPFETLATFDWTAVPAKPSIRFDSEEAYESPGPPPWVRAATGLPVWPVVSLIIGVVMVGVSAVTGTVLYT